MKTRITLLIVASLALASCKAGFSGSIDNPTAATTPTKLPAASAWEAPITGISAVDATSMPI